jgi:hypothetical protein
MALEKTTTGKHAMVQREGYTVPLIGIPPDAVLEECDCCHKMFGLAKMQWTGKQMLCAECAASKIKNYEQTK